MGQPAMKVGVVDIGTNSMRLLITDGAVEDGRWAEVTGLGAGVDATGRLSEEAIARSVEVLDRFGSRMDTAGVERRRAIATSATRDARNRDVFLDAAADALRVRPEMISGPEEARLAFEGATSSLFEVGGSVVVSDIGGGSTEFVTSNSDLSVDIGSVRLTERLLPDRPSTKPQMEAATSHVRELFADVEAGPVENHVGVAGTWTSLAAIAAELPAHDSHSVHGHSLSKGRLAEVSSMLAGMTVEETAAIPSLDPNRAPVILAGSVVALGVMDTLGVTETLVSERDTLDGVAARLLALA